MAGLAGGVSVRVSWSCCRQHRGRLGAQVAERGLLGWPSPVPPPPSPARPGQPPGAALSCGSVVV